MFITRKGVVFGGSQTDDSFEINPPTSKDYKLKENWHETIPDVWEYDITSAKTRLTKEIYDGCDAKLNVILSQWPKNEIDSWSNQAEQAVKWNNLTNEQKEASLDSSEFTMIAGIATTKTVVDIDSLVAKILINKLAYETFTGKVINRKRILKKQVDDAATEEDINAIIIDYSDI